jgi:HAE1 family hydrophobic/amphiphilic exporter-1
MRYLIVVLAGLVLVRALLETKKLEKEFIGIAEQNKFTVFVELPTGAKLDVSDRIVAQVEKIISRLPEVKTSTAKIEPWSSKIYVELYPLNKRKRATSDIMNSLRPLTERLEPAFIYYEEAEEVGTKEILIELYGYDYDVLKSLAIQTAQRIQSIPKFTDTKIRMREGRPEMRLAIDKRQAAMFGLTVEDIALGLHTQMRGLVATRFRGISDPIIRVKDQTQSREEKPSSSADEQKILEQKTKEMRSMRLGSPSGETQEVETIARLEEKFRRTFADLRRISFTTPDGNQVYLSQMASFKFDLGPSEIWRKNKSRMVQVSANTGGLALGTAAEKVQEVLKDYKFPKDYFWQFGGNYDKMIRNQKELTFAIILSLILVYMLLASLFESFSQPFIILMTVPLAAIGAIAALRITHKPVGTGVLVGGIMLGGIVVNNAIVLVDRINFLKHRRSVEKTAVSDREIIIIASHDRLRPIMMTSLTTILGLIPMALDKSESANLWSPLAITVIGGMTVATFLTLFVIPCVYLIFKDLRLIRK